MRYDGKHVGLKIVFQDLKRAKLNMSWVYGHIGETLADLKIPVFAKPREIHEKVNLHRLRQHLANESQNSANYVASLLGSSMLEKGIEDASKIVGFLRGERESYDNVDNFELIYDYKELTAVARPRFTLPVDFFCDFSTEEWETRSAIRDVTGESAKTFGNANNLNRLHFSTTLHVELCDFAIDVDRQPVFLNALKERHETAMNEAGVVAMKDKGGRNRAEWWDRFWAEVCGQLLDETLVPKSKSDLRKALDSISAEMKIAHGETAMQRPTKLLWDRISPEIRRIYGVGDDEN
jgi:hypothetical protein